MNQLRLDPLSGRWVVVSPGRSERPYSFVTRTPQPDDALGPSLPVLPRQRGGHPARPRDLRAHRALARPGRAEPLPRLRGRRALRRGQPRPGLHPGLRRRHPRDPDLLPRARRHLGPAEPGAGRARHGGPARPARGTRVPAQPALHPGHRELGPRGGCVLEHPHGQLLGMSFIPRELAEEQARFARFVGSCLLCTTIEAEEDSTERVIYANDRVVVVCPFWSAVPYEMLVMPREHNPHLHRSPTEDLIAVGEALRRSLQQLAEGDRRRGLQRRLPLGAVPGRRAVPLARPHLAQGDDDRRLRVGHRGGHQCGLARGGCRDPQGLRPRPLTHLRLGAPSERAVRTERASSRRPAATRSRSGPTRPPIPGVPR